MKLISAHRRYLNIALTPSITISNPLHRQPCLSVFPLRIPCATDLICQPITLLSPQLPDFLLHSLCPTPITGFSPDDPQAHLQGYQCASVCFSMLLLNLIMIVKSVFSMLLQNFCKLIVARGQQLFDDHHAYTDICANTHLPIPSEAKTFQYNCFRQQCFNTC